VVESSAIEKVSASHCTHADVLSMNEPAGHADCADVGSGKEVRRKSARAREGSSREPLISPDLP
jgi:hypothetical protein